MRAGAHPGRAILHLALVRLRVGDEFLQIVDRQILADDQNPRRFRNQPDQLEIPGGVVGRLLVERLAVGVRAGVADQQRVSVRRRLGDAGAADRAGRGTDILHDDGLPEHFAKRHRL